MSGTRSFGSSLRGRLLLPVAFLPAACGSGSTAASPRASSAATAAATSAADPRSAAIIAGYVNASNAFVHAVTTQNPNDPAIAATMYGAELFTVTKNLGIDYDRNIIGRGDVQVRDPHVVSVDGTTAVVRDCVWDTLHLYDSKTGAPVQGAVSGQGGEDEGITATLVYFDGAWKLSAKDIKAGSCPAGY